MSLLHDVGEVERNIGFIGAGWVVKTCYIPAARRLKLPVRFVFDQSEPAATAAGTMCGAAIATTDLSSVTAREGDIVVVATPNAEHVRHCREALRLGSIAVCEKNFAPNVDDARGLLSDVRPDRLWLSTPYRFRSDVRALLAHVGGGEIGNVNRVRVSWQRLDGVPRPGSWYTQRRFSGGGVLSDLGPHVLDLGLLLLSPGEVVDEFAWLGDRRRRSGNASTWMPGRDGDADGDFDVEQQAQACYRFDDGKLLEISLAWAGFGDCDKTIFEVHGDKGRAELVTLLGYAPDGPKTFALTIHTAAGKKETVQPLLRTPADDFGNMLQAIIAPQAANGAACRGETAVRVVDLIERAYRRTARA